MTQLSRYDPPAYLPDFNTIPGQLAAWHNAVSAYFDAAIDSERKKIKTDPQFYNAASFDPGGVVVEQAVTWNAFPKEMLRRFGRERALQLADRLWPIEYYRNPPRDPDNPAGTKLGVFYRPQEEYCEWHVERDAETQKLRRITFTSEPPEYWQALFGLIPGSNGSPDIPFPGDRDVLLGLYRDLVSPDVQLEDLIAPADIPQPGPGTLALKGQYYLYNKWNTTHGIAHLNSPPNSLFAEIQLGADASVLRTDREGRLLVEPEALICYAGYGGPNRNSDPTIGAAVNALARLGARVTLKNPVGLYMDHIDLSGWAAPDGSDVTQFVRIVRGSPGMIERMVVEAPPGHTLSVGDLTIAGDLVRYGGQVAECITVKLTGLANILPTPVRTPPAGIAGRGEIDPAYAQVVDQLRLTDPSRPGTVEAFLHEGTAPGSTAASFAAAPKGRRSTPAAADRRPRRMFRTR